MCIRDRFQADLLVLGPHARRSLFDFGSTARALLSRAVIPVWNQTIPAAPIGTILVPVDFSENSRRALEFAHTLAARLEATLRVMHCYSPPTFAYSDGMGLPAPTDLIDHERASAKDELAHWMTELDDDPVKAEPCFVEGDVIESIVDETRKADLVVLGTHGRTGLSRFLMGSVAYGALKQSPKPVVVVPSPAQAWLLPESEPLGAVAPASMLLA